MGAFNPPATALAYRGPIAPVPSANGTVPRLFAAIADVVSNGIGLIQLGVVCNPTTSADWLNFATTYTEFRLLGAKMRFIPSFFGTASSGLTALPGTMVLCALRDATVSAPAAQQALETSPNRSNSIYRPLVLEMRSSGALETMWQNTDTAGALNFTFGLTASGLTPSITYGQYVLTMLVQFRNAR
jgi:hypothetical protein